MERNVQVVNAAMDSLYRIIHIATDDYNSVYRPVKSDPKFHENSSLAKTFELLTLLFTLFFQRFEVDYFTFGPPLTKKRIYVHLSLTISQGVFFPVSLALTGVKDGGRIFKTVCWVEILISSLALTLLGKPLKGFLFLITPLIFSLGIYRFHTYSTTTNPSIAKEVDRSPPTVAENKEFHFSNKKEIDVPLFLKEVERFPNQTQVTVDFSYSSFDDQSLPLTLCRLFSAQSSDLYEHEILLYHCTQVTEKGIRKLLRLFPRLTLHLSGTSLTPIEVYHLQSEFRESTLQFHSGIEANASQSDCRLCFNGNSIPFFKKLLIDEFPYFKALLESGMKESNEQELDLTTIIRSEQAIRIFISYLTTGSFPEMSYEEAKGSVEFLAPLLGDSPDFMRVLDLGIARKAFFITDQNDPLLAWRELLDYAKSGLLISRNAFIHYFKRQFGISFGFDADDKLSELSIHDVEPLPHELLTKIEETLEEISPSLTVILDLSSSLYANKKRVFDFLQNEGIKKVHLTGTFWDLQEITRREVEKKLTKLKLLGEGEIDLGEVRKCTELTDLSYSFPTRTSILSFYPLKKLERISDHSFEPLDLREVEGLFPALKKISFTIANDRLNSSQFQDWSVQKLIGRYDGNMRLSRYRTVTLVKNQQPKRFLYQSLTAEKYSSFLPKIPFKKIEFVWCHLSDKLLEKVKKNAEQLESLTIHLWSDMLDTTAVPSLLSSSKKLTHLSLFSDPKFDLMALFENPLAIESLSLRIRTISLNNILFILHKCPCLQEIELWDHQHISEIAKLYPKLKITTFV